ncbi:DUF2793 domain-containing protein [Sphingosinithalassobacter sp. LHW66-3]|uniref:DUF2793 domain-containing protein n=1 Tax=Sphingosinithalassobacter sp. LHW66-3 TaxID=3424718 RepID=UPI003D6AE56E
MSAESTPRLTLPLLAAGQAQKEMFHNEALARLDLLVQGSAEDMGAEIPPEDPEPGQAWVLGADPTGAWAGHAHALAGWTEGGWRFAAPREGTRVWVAQEGAFALFSGGSWTIGEVRGRVVVEGHQVVGRRGAAIGDPAGGTTVDVEARIALSAVLAAMRAHGLIDPPDL